MDHPPPVNPLFYYGSEPPYLHQTKISSNADLGAPAMKATLSSSGSFSDEVGYYDYKSTPDPLGGMNSSMIPIDSEWPTQHMGWTEMEDTPSLSSSYDVDIPKDHLAIPDVLWQSFGSMEIPNQIGITKKEIPFPEFEPQFPMEDVSLSPWTSYPWNPHNNQDAWADTYLVGASYNYSGAGYYESRSIPLKRQVINQEGEPLSTASLPADYLHQPHLSQPIQSSPVAAGATTHMPTALTLPAIAVPEVPSYANISAHQNTSFHSCDGNPGTEMASTSFVGPVHQEHNTINNMTSHLQSATQMPATSSSYPQPHLTFPSPIRNTLQSDDARNSLLVEWKRSGLSYKDIKRIGNFKEAESTLRGRYRTLTKAKERRVRKPKWQDKDIQLLREAVKIHTEKTTSESYPGPPSFPTWPQSELGESNEHPRHDPDGSCTRTYPSSATSEQLGHVYTQPPKVSWKKVSEYIFAHGGSYEFGNATCKKKWCEIHGILI
ncbi:hypothetical protein N7493_006730 [Penicillium malachiteum]|uniref:Myb-like domain-containing protein n=1 Tax=Penicillium malachiteum TaxID=1324776 RepID=A0AAD6HJM0_9EURO|nr:hypothetical protein N7493_006730 [Penicillium malachiteum]